MKLSKIYILLISSLLAIVVCALLTHYNATQKRDTVQDLVLTHELLEQTLDLFSTLKDAETGQLGFLLTRDTLYLVSYQNSINHINSKLETLSELTKNSPVQQHIVSENLASLVTIKSTFMANTVNLMQGGHADSALALVNTDIGLTTMNQIRTVINNIITAEKDMIEERAGLLDKIYSFSNFTLYINLLFIGIILIWAISTIHVKRAENSKLIYQLEQQNQHLEEEVEKRTQEITKKNQALVQLNEEKNRFMGIAAHDLRSPLSAINGFCYLFKMKGENLDEEQKKWVEHIGSTSDRMSQLINNLMDVNRIEEGRLTLHPEVLDILPVVREAVEGYQRIAEKKNIGVQLLTQEETMPLVTDKNHLLQIMDNLVCNAIKFSPPRSNIRIHMKRANNLLQMEVCDEGPGIEKHELDLLFQKFKKLSNAPTGGEGSTGLGLYITKELIDLMGGTIYCKSKKNMGTKFIVELPAVLKFNMIDASA